MNSFRDSTDNWHPRRPKSAVNARTLDIEGRDCLWHWKSARGTKLKFCQFTANSPAANSTGWSCLPIRFKREIFTSFIRTSKRTVTFALKKGFSKPFSCSEWRIFVAWHRNSGVFDLHFYLVSYKVCYGITFNAAYYQSLFGLWQNTGKRESSLTLALYNEHVPERI